MLNSSFFNQLASYYNLALIPMLNSKLFPSKAPDFRGLNRSVSQMELYSPTSSIRSGYWLVALNHKKLKVWDEQQDVDLLPGPISRASLFNVASANPGNEQDRYR